MRIDEIKELPTLTNELINVDIKIHESVFRSYQILEFVKAMLDLWDSRETIKGLIKYLEQDKVDMWEEWCEKDNN